MVLHTWGQRLQHHPHVHCVVPMGGLAPDGARWIHARPRFFLPIPVLRTLFRGKLVAGLRDAFRAGRLDFPGALAPLKPDAAFGAFLRSLYRQPWVVYAKPPFGSPSHVLHYLARYTHRVAISNHRLVTRDPRHRRRFGGRTTATGAKCGRSRSTSTNFSVASSLHVLPKRFVRIRYFGFLASRCRTRALPQCRQALAGAPTPPVEPPVAAPPTNIVAMSPLWRPHAHRRTADRTTALPSRAPRDRHHDTS